MAASTPMHTRLRSRDRQSDKQVPLSAQARSYLAIYPAPHCGRRVFFAHNPDRSRLPRPETRMRDLHWRPARPKLGRCVWSIWCSDCSFCSISGPCAGVRSPYPSIATRSPAAWCIARPDGYRPVAEIPLGGLTPVFFAELPAAGSLNPALIAAFHREKDGADVRRTHMFEGRFENTYIPRQRLPEMSALDDFAVAAAAQILGRQPLRHGFWFNEMAPGHSTTLHSHEEDDELLSAVYYLLCPEDSGRLLLHDDEALITVTPHPGLLVLFPPDLPHEVEKNTGAGTRLSVAFNFGPAGPAT